MKKHLLTLFVLAISTVLFAQTPQGINYQVIARDNAGQPIVNTNLTFTINVKQGGSIIFTDTHTKTSNSFGLCQMVIGQGGVMPNPTFNNINWDAITKIAISATDGTTTYNFGEQDFQSVPYALYSHTAENLKGFQLDLTTNTPTPNQVLTYDGTNWIPKTLTGGGTDDQKIDDFTLNGTDLELSLEDDGEATKTVDLSSLKELPTTATLGQTIVWNTVNSQWEAKDGLPDGTANNQVLTWDGSKWKPLAPTGGTNTDSQTLEVIGNTLSITGGNTVTLPSGGTMPLLGDGQLIVSNGTTNVAVTIAGDVTLSGKDLTIGDGKVTPNKIQAGAAKSILTTNASNAVTWFTPTGNNKIIGTNASGDLTTLNRLTATNGLTIPSGTNEVKLGGTLTETTTIDVNGSDLEFNNANEIHLKGSILEMYTTVAGTATRTLSLESGKIRYPHPTMGVNKVLTSDANGNATWETPTGGSSPWTVGTGASAGTISTSDRVSIGTSTGIGHLFQVVSSEVGYVARITNSGGTSADENGLEVTINENSPTATVLQATGSGNTGLFVKGDGKVGLGVLTPTAKLDIAGDFKLKPSPTVSSQMTVGNNSTSDEIQLYLRDKNNTLKVAVRSGGNSYFNGGNVGIGTTAPSEKLEVVGNTEISGEYKYATAKTRYYSLNASDFAGTGWTISDKYGKLNSSTSSYSGLHLPGGAKITSVLVKVLGTSQVIVGLYRENFDDNLITIASGTVTPTSTSSYVDLSFAPNHTVDNSAGSYYVKYTSDGGSQLLGVRIIYTVTQAK